MKQSANDNCKVYQSPLFKGLFSLYRYFTFVLVLVSQFTKAQFYSLPSEYFFSIQHEKNLSAFDSALHISFKPEIPGFCKKHVFTPDTAIFFHSTKHQKLTDALFNNHVIHLRSKNKNEGHFDVFINPLLNFEYGKDFSDESGEKLYSNTRGVIAGGHVGENLYFETLLSENQSFFPYYLDSFVLEQKVIPGQGRWKTFKSSGYDYAFSSGFVSVQAGKHLNIQFGHGKHKIGNGYRSLFLSDNAFNYPYLRFTQQWFKGRIQYSNLYTVFMNLIPALENPPPGTEALFQKKTASFQYLSANLGKRFSIGFFQGLMWEPADGKNQQHLDFRYFNPVIYTNLASFGLNDSKHNLMIGTELNIKITKSLSAYGQFVLDDISPVGYSSSQGCGYQTGLKYFNAFALQGLFLQLEYNSTGVAQYNSSLNGLAPYYTHYNQNLASAFPNGTELIVIGNYSYKRFFINAKFNSQNSATYNSNPSYHTLLLQGKIGYTINPAYNLNIYLSVNNRLQKFDNFSNTYNETSYVSFGLKTGLYNLYYDF